MKADLRAYALQEYKRFLGVRRFFRLEYWKVAQGIEPETPLFRSICFTYYYKQVTNSFYS